MKPRLNRRFVLALAGAACWPFSSQSHAAEQSVSRAGVAFGTIVRLTLARRPADGEEKLFDQCFAIIRRVERAASLFRADSEIVRLNAQGFVDRPSEDLVALMTLSARVSALSDGAFDVTVQPLWLACDRAAQARDWPSAARIEAMREQIDWRAIEVSPERVAFRKPGMGATLNGVAQGYAAEKIAEFLVEQGVANAFLDTGEIESMGERPEGDFWRAGLAAPRDPEKFFGVVGPYAGCLSTSGDYATSWSPDFSRNHIIDPATGLSPTELAQACVIAPKGGEADALSTALMVMGPERGLKLMKSLPGIEALVIAKNGACAKTPGFPLSLSSTG